MPARETRSFLSRAGSFLERKLLAGFLALFPLAATVFVARRVLEFLDGIIGRHLTKEIPGLGLLALVLLLVATGALVTSYLGRKTLQIFEGLLARLPFARTIYVGAKQLAEALSPEGRKGFQKVVLVEYPRKGLWSVGLLTKEASGEVRDRLGQPVSWVLCPHTPNVTSGVLLLVPDDQIVSLEMSVEDAVKLVISGGLVAPPGRLGPP